MKMSCCEVIMSSNENSDDLTEMKTSLREKDKYSLEKRKIISRKICQFDRKNRGGEKRKCHRAKKMSNV